MEGAVKPDFVRNSSAGHFFAREGVRGRNRAGGRPFGDGLQGSGKWRQRRDCIQVSSRLHSDRPNAWMEPRRPSAPTPASLEKKRLPSGNAKLRAFYERNGFSACSRRYSETDGVFYLQMFRFLK